MVCIWILLQLLCRSLHIITTTQQRALATCPIFRWRTTTPAMKGPSSPRSPAATRFLVAVDQEGEETWIVDLLLL